MGQSDTLMVSLFLDCYSHYSESRRRLNSCFFELFTFCPPEGPTKKNPTFLQMRTTAKKNGFPFLELLDTTANFANRLIENIAKQNKS